MTRKLGLLCVFCSIAYCMFTQQKSDLHLFAIFDKIYKNSLGARRRYASKDRKEYA